jgi:hypothetical protein
MMNTPGQRESEPVHRQDPVVRIVPDPAVETGVSGLWVAFFAAIGVSLINNSQAAKALQVAVTALH